MRLSDFRLKRLKKPQEKTSKRNGADIEGCIKREYHVVLILDRFCLDAGGTDA